MNTKWNKDNLKNEDNFKNEEDLKNEDDHKKKDDLKNKVDLRNWLVMLSVSHASKNAYSDGKTSGVLSGRASGANRCYVLAHCGGGRGSKFFVSNDIFSENWN